MNLEDTHYNAFISYRHTEPDMYVAKTLHKMLESFKTPKDILEDHPDLPKGIERVFRDQEELPLASNLADPITEALSNSDNLIVICTPRLPQSAWCLKEIDTFIAMHGRERVFAVLAEGEPEESFPPQLLFDENGNVMEPLAADFRGKNKHEVNKKMKLEVLRLIAPMFGLNFDDLRQRHKEQRMKKMLSIGAVVLAVMFGFAAYCGITAIKIKNQAAEIQERNDRITEQNQQIILKNEEITQQSQVIEDQYRESQLKYSNSVAEIVTGMMEDGRAKDAIYALRKAMPDAKNSEEMPYSSMAQFAMTKAVGGYSASTFIPAINFDCESSITGMWLSPQTTRMATLDETNTLRIWDTENGKILRESYVGGVNNYTVYVMFLSENVIMAYDADGEYIYDIDNDKKTYVFDNSATIYANYESNKAVAVYGSVAKIIDIDAQKVIGEIAIEEGEGYNYLVTKGNLGNNDVLALYIMDAFTSDEKLVCYDINSKDKLLEFVFPEENQVSSLCVDGDSLYVSGSHPKDGSLIDFLGFMQKYSISANRKLWDVQLPNSSSFDMFVFGQDGNERLAVCAYTDVLAFDCATGEIVYNASLSDRVMGFFKLSDSGALVVSEDASMYTFAPLQDVLVLLDDFQYDLVNDISNVGFVKGHLFVRAYESNYVTEYQTVSNETMKAVGDGYSGDYVSDNAKTAVKSTYDIASGQYKYTVTNPITGNTVATFYEKVGDTQFLENGNKFAIVGKEITLYDLITGECLGKTEPVNGGGLYRMADETSAIVFEEIYAGDTKTVNSYDVITGENTGLCMEGISSDTYRKIYTFSPTRESCVHIDQTKNTMDVYKNGNAQSVKTLNMSGGVDSVVYTSDGKYICVGYNDNSIEIYDTDKFELVETLYNMVSGLKKVEYVPSQKDYLIVGLRGILVDENWEAIAEIAGCIGYDDESDSITIRNSGVIYQSPIIEYEDIIKMADKKLEGYTPSDSFLSKYGLGEE